MLISPNPTNFLVRASLPATLPTDKTAAAINRKLQTFSKWACPHNGPIRPSRINERPTRGVSGLQALLNGEGEK
jgi:hypothetical protein